MYSFARHIVPNVTATIVDDNNCTKCALIRKIDGYLNKKILNYVLKWTMVRKAALSYLTLVYFIECAGYAISLSLSLLEFYA